MLSFSQDAKILFHAQSKVDSLHEAQSLQGLYEYAKAVEKCTLNNYLPTYWQAYIYYSAALVYKGGKPPLSVWLACWSLKLFGLS